MKKLILLFLLAVSGTIYGAEYDVMTNEMRSIMRTTASNISAEMAKHMGFYSGVGNVTPANASGLLGFKIGFGLGLNMTPGFLKAFFSQDVSGFTSGGSGSNSIQLNELSSVLGYFPFPYDLFYGKIGLPLLPMDVGIRLGFIPNLSFDLGGGNNMTVGEFHFGAEARYVLIELPTGIFKLDIRLSYDYEGGFLGVANTVADPAFTNDVLVGTNVSKTTFTYAWSGSSIGLKTVGGINFGNVGGIYTGLGLNMNFGAVTALFTSFGAFKTLVGGSTIMDITEKTESNYPLMDMRLMAGFNLFFISMAMEYNLFSQDIAVTFIPFSMAF